MWVKEFDARKYARKDPKATVQFSVRHNGQYVTDHGNYDTIAYLKNKKVLCYDHSRKLQIMVEGKEARELGIEMLALQTSKRTMECRQVQYRTSNQNRRKSNGSSINKTSIKSTFTRKKKQTKFIQFKAVHANDVKQKKRNLSGLSQGPRWFLSLQ